jgi:hypothetical protein
MSMTAREDEFLDLLEQHKKFCSRLRTSTAGTEQTLPTVFRKSRYKRGVRSPVTIILARFPHDCTELG